MLNKIFEKIESAKSIVILTHQNPDIDAVSSSHALGMLIGKKADIIIPTYPENFSFLPNINMLKKSSNKNYDLAIALDCANIKRLTGYEEYFKKAQYTVITDHHVTNEKFAKLNYVVELAPACAQILADIFMTRNITITKDIATCLLAGIISDTAGLTERNVTSKTFNIISNLVSKGANYKETYKNIMNSCTMEQVKLKKLIWNRLYILNGNIAVSYLKKEDILGIDSIDHKYLIKEYQNICNIDVAILFIEHENVVKVSFRSEKVDVLSICKKFGGGGHRNSAGCSIQDNLKNVKVKICNEVIREIS